MPVARSSHSAKLIITPMHLVDKGSIYFSPIITEFSDTWTPRWSSTNVYGRNDPIAFFNGTSRQLTLGFRVISDSLSEARTNMGKISTLVQAQHATYIPRPGQHPASDLTRIKSPPYFKFKFLNIVGARGTLQGYINGPIQINPGFQSKSQPQYINSSPKEIYFSDVNIVLRIQVLSHDPRGVGYGDSGNSSATEFEPEGYPYGITSSPREFQVSSTTTPLQEIGGTPMPRTPGLSPVAPPTVESLTDSSVQPTDADLKYLIKAQDRKRSLADNGVVDNTSNILKPQT